MTEYANTTLADNDYKLNVETHASSEVVGIYDYPNPKLASEPFVLTQAREVARYLVNELSNGERVISTAQNLMGASESVLAKLWDTPEEDEAWDYL